MKKVSFVAVVSTLCLSLWACNSDTFGSIGGECASHKECKSGVCDNGKCVEQVSECTKSDDCLGGAECVDFKCQLPAEECSDTKACPDGQTCTNGKCEAASNECSDTKICADGAECVNGACVPLVGDCKTTADCNEGQICFKTYCVEKTSEFDDADNDMISDKYEGKDEAVDTDADTTPDYMDSDSDNDTVPDSLEYGNSALGYEPADSDSDTIPDFRDTDSDENGILDAVECKANDQGGYPDLNADGTLDCHDMDNDGDGVDDLSEITGLVLTKGGRPVLDGNNVPVRGADCNNDKKPDAAGSASAPWDCDADTVPDYMDLDSDGDTIPDIIEGSYVDSDGDGFYNRYDQDSDGDTIPDKDEAGANPSTPRDTDADTVPDFLDKDSDNDGLPDSKERELGTDPLKEDSDGDGVSDLVEFAAGTNPKDANDNPVKNGDFVFLVPYQKPSTPPKGSLSFATSVQVVDVYFAIDRSGSTDTEINTLSAKLKGIMDSLRCNVLNESIVCNEDKDCASVPNSVCSVTSHKCIENPLTKTGGCLADMWTGVGSWGTCGRFTHVVSVTSDVQKTVDTLNLANLPKVGSTENAWDAALCAVANATGAEDKIMCPKRETNRPCASNMDTCVGFRNNALRVLIVLTDEGQMSGCSNPKANGSAHNGTSTLSAADTAMARDVGVYARSKNVNLIGFWSSDYNSISKKIMEPMVSGNGLDTSLFMIKCMDAEIETATKSAIMKISKDKPLKITTEAVDIDAGASKFIKSLTVNIVDSAVEGKTCTKVSGILPGKFEGIASLLPGRSVCYDLTPIDQNNDTQALNEPKVLKAKIILKGDGSTLNERIAYFLIPPTFEGGVN